MKTQLICGCLLSLFVLASSAAVPRDFVVGLTAAVSDTAPHITLSWTQRVQSNISAQKIHRRPKGSTTWEKLADLTATDTGYIDATAVAGVEYEYWMQRTFTGLSPNTAVGYLSAGVKIPEVHSRGTLLLVIDDTMITPLAPEIGQLRRDLAADGWKIQTISAPRTGTAASTKALITAAYNADPAEVKSVYILGHVPIPYSGNQAPDGHGDHIGAWPADGYYADMDGVWTDTTVNNTSATSALNDNIPGDGKFDQIYLPGLVELEIGRVDLFNMTKAPSSAVSETSLLRRYLNRTHDFRHKRGAYAAIPRRSLIRDGFGHAFTSEPFAVNGWSGALSSVGPTVDQATSGQWFSATYAGGKDYLLGHGCGGGSYESASTFGTTTDLGRKPSRVVFMSLFGSYHGDWGASNNLMRAVLAGNATGDSLGLTCFWGGRPNWFTHSPGMGETMGYMAKVSLNAGVTGGGSYVPGGSYARGVHIGLMGDPALRLHAVEPPRNLSATSSSGAVDLSWTASTETGLQGYHVYRGESAEGPFTRLTPSPVSSTAFNDPTGTPGIRYSYLVRTLKLEQVPGGSYYNLSIGSSVSATVESGSVPLPANPGTLSLNLANATAQLSWQDNAADETGYRVERKTNAAGTFSVVANLPADSTSYSDSGPFTHGSVYFYRIVATGSAGNSEPSEEESFQAFAGFVEFTAARMKVNKNAGTATVSLTRSGGAIGAVSVTCTTSNITASAGTHYSSSVGAVSWTNGETGTKTFSIPITNTPAPQLPRQFKVTLSSATGSLSVTAWNAISVQIEDPTAVLDAPWTSAVIGTVTDSSPAVSAEGFIGEATVGGDGAESGDTAESGRFTYQTRAGDGTMTIRVPELAVAQSGARFGVMVRASTTNTAIMAATMVASSPANFGSKFVTRAAAAAANTATPSTDNNLDTPRWLRLTRFGNTFISEVSPDGTAWTLLGTSTLASMPSSAVWGIFHYSSGPDSNTQLRDYHLATYDNVSLGNIPPPPPPSGFTATPGSTNIVLAWTDASHTETGFEIERRAANGTWASLVSVTANTTSANDTPALPGVIYQYRVRALSATGPSSWTEASATSPGPASGFRQWLFTNGLPMDESGAGSATTTAENDQLPNLVKYALGLPLQPPGNGGRLVCSIQNHASDDYLTFRFTIPHPAPPDVSYAVESSSLLTVGSWSDSAIIPVSETIDGNLKTVTVRLDTPVSSGNAFMRLKVTRQ